MARAVTQSIAWGLATFMSGVVFAGGFGVYKVMLPKDGQHSAASDEEHGSEGHGEESHASSGHGEDSHGESPAEAGAHGSAAHGEEDAHGTAAHGEEAKGHGEEAKGHGDAHAAMPEHPADESSAHDKGHDSGHGAAAAKGEHEEEVISADQFKQGGGSHH